MTGTRKSPKKSVENAWPIADAKSIWTMCTWIQLFGIFVKLGLSSYRTTQFCMHTLSFGFLQNAIFVDIDKDNRLFFHQRTYAYKQKLHKSLKLISLQPVKHLNKSSKCNFHSLIPIVCLTHFRKKTDQSFNCETEKSHHPQDREHFQWKIKLRLVKAKLQQGNAKFTVHTYSPFFPKPLSHPQVLARTKLKLIPTGAVT